MQVKRNSIQKVSKGERGLADKFEPVLMKVHRLNELRRNEVKELNR